MSKSDLKKKKDLFKDLDKLYIKNKPRIIEWLVDIATQYNGVHNNKIDNLLITSKIQINTTSEYGVYNLILQWFLNNKENFIIEDELDLFDNIPSTTFTKISKQIMMQSSSPRAASYQSLNIQEAIKKWKENPNIDPYNGSEVKTSIVLKSKYFQLYEKYIIHLMKDLKPVDIANPEIFEKIRKQLPTNHIYMSKEIDYIENLKHRYNDQLEDKWIDFLVKQKVLIYSKEKILEKEAYTVYDHLFMHLYLKKNKKHFKNYEIREIYIDNQEFLYETLQNQIRLVKAVDMDCEEVIDSMLNVTSEENKGINFAVKGFTSTTDEWPYHVPPLLKLFTEYIYEISYYLLSIQKLNSTIYDKYFLYDRKETINNTNKIEYIESSINYNKYRLKTILNIILGSMYNSDNTEKINIIIFLKILWDKVKDTIFKEQNFLENKSYYSRPSDKSRVLKNRIDKCISEVEIKNFKMFFVSSLFDIETLHKQSQKNNNILYEPVIDPYSNLPEPPKMPRMPVISQQLQRYKMTSNIVGKNSAKEKELKEFKQKESNYKKELKEYDKSLKKYNDKYLDKKLSPYFSVKLSRAKSVINNKNSLRLSYSPLKVSAKSLTKFKSSKNKALLSKFEKEPYSRTYKRNEIEKIRQKEIEEKERIEMIRKREREREREEEREREREREREIANQEFMDYWFTNGGGTKKKLSKSDLKLKLALEADNFKSFAKSLSPSGKSPRQKYIGCDLNDNDPITQESFSDMHFKKIKYLSKIKTKLPDGKIITHCYDTIPFYNYILDCNNKGKNPINLKMGKVELTQEQKEEVFKKIKFFTKQPTLGRYIDTSIKYFLKAKYRPHTESSGDFTTFVVEPLINIGSIDFDVLHNDLVNGSIGLLKPTLHKGAIISRDDMLFEDTSDETVLLIQKGMENGSLLRVKNYPYWKNEYGRDNMPYDYKLLSLPSFIRPSTRDTVDRLEFRTRIFNNTLRRLI